MSQQNPIPENQLDLLEDALTTNGKGNLGDKTRLKRSKTVP